MMRTLTSPAVVLSQWQLANCEAAVPQHSDQILFIANSFCMHMIYDIRYIYIILGVHCKKWKLPYRLSDHVYPGETAGESIPTFLVCFRVCCRRRTHICFSIAHDRHLGSVTNPVANRTQTQYVRVLLCSVNVDIITRQRCASNKEGT